MSAQEGGGDIRTSDPRFIKRGPNRLNYLLETNDAYFIFKREKEKIIFIIKNGIVAEFYNLFGIHKGATVVSKFVDYCSTSTIEGLL
jgi:hypothetical protein